jgi:sialidase-1
MPDSPFFDSQLLFAANTGGYKTYRIPAIVATPKGTVLAFCVGRKEPSDWAEIAIFLRRSTDGGAAWQPPQKIAAEPGSTVDNPTPIVDRQTGEIHLLYQVNYERCYYMCSRDDGATFTPPADITETFVRFRPEYAWTVLAPGPGHGIQLQNGRLLAPVWLSTGEGTEFGAGQRGHRPSAVSVVYSDDHGRSWQRGHIVVRHSAVIPNPSETTALQLHDGRVLLNMRSESPRFRRLVSYSADGATGWSEPVFHEGLFEPVCFGSILRLSEQPAGSKNRILFCNPDSSRNPETIRNTFKKRENLTVKLSYDEGQTWPVARVIDPGIAGYSDIAVGPDGMIYCLYEGGGAGGNMFINTQVSVVRFNLEWLTAGEDSLE